MFDLASKNETELKELKDKLALAELDEAEAWVDGFLTLKQRLLMLEQRKPLRESELH